jgi:hypothetical protein
VIDNLERRLKFLMVPYIGGERLVVSHRQVKEILVRHASVLRGLFSVHAFRREYFLVVFSNTFDPNYGYSIVDFFLET